MPLVSVIMSIYNEPINYISNSINSIINQTISDIEFIIALDNPNRKDVIEYVNSVNDNRIHFFVNNHNIGLPESLNKCLKISRGNYIARMDADDISVSNRLEKQIEYLEEYNLDLCGSLLFNIDKKGQIIGKNLKIKDSGISINKMLDFRSPLAHPTWFGKANLFHKLGGYKNFHTCEDYDFLLRGRNHGAKFGLVPEYLLYYRENELSISNHNAYKQFISTQILSKWNYDKELSVEEFDKKVKKKYSVFYENSFLKAKLILKKAVSKNTCMKLIFIIYSIAVFPPILKLYSNSMRTLFIRKLYNR